MRTLGGEASWRPVAVGVAGRPGGRGRPASRVRGPVEALPLDSRARRREVPDGGNNAKLDKVRNLKVTVIALWHRASLANLIDNFSHVLIKADIKLRVEGDGDFWLDDTPANALLADVLERWSQRSTDIRRHYFVWLSLIHI